MIEDCKIENIQPCSVDLTTGKIFRIKETGLIDPEKDMPELVELEFPYIMEPGEYILALSKERLNQKHTQYAAAIFPRTKAYRCGLSIECGIAYPYYNGQIIVGIRNMSGSRVKISEGMSLIQVMFMDVSGDIAPLKHRFKDGEVI